MSKKTVIIIVGLITVLIIVPLIVFGLLSIKSSHNASVLTSNPPDRSVHDITEAIAKSNPYLNDASGDPTFKYLGSKRIANNWYVAWIDNNQTKVLINDPALGAQYMRVILGPDSSFDKSVIHEKHIPNNIYETFINAKNV